MPSPNPIIYPKVVGLVSPTPVMLTGVNVNRIRVIIENTGFAQACIGYNKDISTSDTFRLGSGGYMIEDDYKGEIWGFCNSGTTTVIVGEA